MRKLLLTLTAAVAFTGLGLSSSAQTQRLVIIPGAPVVQWGAPYAPGYVDWREAEWRRHERWREWRRHEEWERWHHDHRREW